MSSLTFFQLGTILYETINRPGTNFFDLAPIFSNLTRTDIISLINSFLIEITANDKITDENKIYFYQQPGLHLLMRFTHHKSSSNTLSASEVDAIVMNLSEVELNIPLYHCNLQRERLYEKPNSLKREEDLILPSYKPVCLPAFSSIADFYNASHNAPLLIVHSDKKARTTWVFNQETLDPIRRISTDVRASRIRLILELFQAMQVVKGIKPLLKKLILSDYDANVRWEAMKYYYKINGRGALPLLRQIASQDKDPEIKRASQKTLALMGE
ncbi:MULTISPECIES: HEAT repeat domain-containing protein [Legionella]|uniref:HEAT repeat domain-containing protein n=1 Tax=Legionella resiliens TaxID=2905958 RepID=A0ABS8X3J0_9GAMM|nr:MULTISPECIES: HEAT repeat domain-containing protein [unclassified Legionella]MCE0724167.1 HEAT repeat domain-containing protein [Legionella sp. 9fVS26]MCE3533320.1 HEAT repeat domain-containing protein [Legionella sp. 8cVS16]